MILALSLVLLGVSLGALLQMRETRRQQEENGALREELKRLTASRSSSCWTAYSNGYSLGASVKQKSNPEPVQPTWPDGYPDSQWQTWRKLS